MNEGSNITERYRFDLIDQEMLASQVVAIMDAHWAKPDAEQKRYVLRRAEQQIEAGFRVLGCSPNPEASPKAS